MCVRYLGFVLLVWFPRSLHAQSAACRAPVLNLGYLVPEQEFYSHETTLIYACESGRKPAVDGWWATSTCLNGTWSHEPQCIDENACMPPTIPNAVNTVNTDGWYEDGDTVRITCDKGYEHKGWDATAICVNGTWTSVPVCERSIHTCGEPPKIPHAVIIHREYQEVFPVDSEVQYECEDGYTAEGATAKKSIICIAGTWTEGPTCSGETRPGTGQGGSTVGGADGGHTTSTGSGTQPGGGGSSSGSGLDDKETQLQITTITNCGRHPVVPYGDVVESTEKVLRFQCAAFYKRVGPETVVCYSNGKWSEVPTCRVAYCSVNTVEYPQLIPDGVKFIKDGDRGSFKCVTLDHWWTDHYSVARCIDGRLSLSRCCDWWDLRRNVC